MVIMLYWEIKLRIVDDEVDDWHAATDVTMFINAVVDKVLIVTIVVTVHAAN